MHSSFAAWCTKRRSRPLGRDPVPFDPALASAPDLHTTAVAHSPEASSQLIEERYECDSGGSLTVTIANRTAAYSRTYRLGRWSLNSKSVKPVRKGKGKK